MPVLLTLLPFAIAATLPTECPDVVTGAEVAALRAEIVAPAVLSVSDALATVPADYGDDACPAEDGAECTAATEVTFSGTVETTRSSDSHKCGWNYAIDGTTTWYTRAHALTARPLDGASLAAGGMASTTLMHDACGEYQADGMYWTGTLAVEGPWKALEDDALEGEAWSIAGRWTGSPTTREYGWDATSGTCAWTATSTAYDCEYSECSVNGTVEVGGVSVTYASLLVYACDGTCAWMPYQSSTWVDGVRTGDAAWAQWEGDFEVGAWADADDDGWAPPADCDDADAAVYPPGGEWDCDGDGYAGLNGDPHSEDCDDTDAAVHPGATDVACDGVNSDCWPDDEDCDGDGHTSPRGDDCDDTDAAVYPGAEDLPDDGVDADCNGVDGVDHDADGYDVTVDCDDNFAWVHPGAPETCGDELDQDCDGTDLACAGKAPPAAHGPEKAGCASVGKSGDASAAAFVLSLALTLRRPRRPCKPTASPRTTA